MNAAQLRLYAILDMDQLSGQALGELTAILIRHGTSMFQLRSKRGSDADMLAAADYIRPLVHQQGLPLLLNDRWQLVAEAGADGVHLGQDDGDLAEVRAALGPQAIIGRSIDHPQEYQSGHDYHGLGPLFPTRSKRDAGPPVGCARLAQWRPHIPGPLVVIGGIDSPQRAAQAIQAGADGVAVLSAFCMAEDPAANCAAFAAAIAAAQQEQP